MVYKFTARAKKAIDLASEIAMDLGHSYIGTEHILYGLAKEGSGVASKVLENQAINAQKIETSSLSISFSIFKFFSCSSEERSFSDV